MEKNRQKLLLLLVTSLSALLAVALVYFYVESRIGAERARLSAGQVAADHPAMREVVVATRPIPPGQTIGPEDVRVARVNQDAIEPSVDLPPLDRIVGQVANQAIHPGEWLLAAKLGGSANELNPLAVVLEPGQRAIRVKVDADTGLLGLIAPTDRVDVVSVFPAGQSGEVASRILLQNVPILAVGNHCRPAQQGSAAKEETAAPKNTREEQKESSVTLAVSSQEAGMLALAINSGKIHLLLRNRADQQRAASPPIRVAALAGASALSAEQSAGENQQRVTVIQGSQITTEVVQ